MKKSLKSLAVLFYIQSLIWLIMLFFDVDNFLSYLIYSFTGFGLGYAVSTINDLLIRVSKLEQLHKTDTQTFKTNVSESTTRINESDEKKYEFSREDFPNEWEWEEYKKHESNERK